MKKFNVKSAYSKKVEEKQRSLSSYLSEVRKDFLAINAAAAAADAKKIAEAAKANKAADAKEKAEAAKIAAKFAEDSKEYIAKEDRSKIDFAKQVFEAAKIVENNLTLAYIKNWYPFINAAGQICDAKKIAAEEEAAAKEARSKDIAESIAAGKSKEEAEKIAAERGLQFTYNSENILLRLVPCKIFTCNKLLTKIAAAKKAEEAKKAEASKLQKQKEEAEKEVAKLEAAKIRVAELEAKIAARKAAEAKAA